MKIEILTNENTNSNHKEFLIQCFSHYKEAYIATAFFKMSGFIELKEQICEFLKRNGTLYIIAGQNFGLTEPQALKEIRALIKNNPSSKLFLAKANYSTDVFHPKLYMFRSGKNICIITGSANLTKGGLVDNEEISIIVESSNSQEMWENTKDYFEMLIDKSNADEATLLVIKQYELFYKKQKRHNESSKSVPKTPHFNINFCYDKLLSHFNKYDDDQRESIYRDRCDNYKQAKHILDSIANSSDLNQKTFEILLDKLVGSKNAGHLWHSGSLFRKRRSVYPYYKEFSELVKYIRHNKNEKVNKVFDNGKSQINKIKGAGVNYLTEIMMTYNYKDYANLNRNPITVLRKEGGVNFKANSSSFSGDDYMEYCELIKEISMKLGLRDMLEADIFFNEIYWEIKNRY